MVRFAIRYPYLVLVACLVLVVLGLTTLLRMPVDLFPEVKIPVVVVATFYPGMPPEQIEAGITSRFERFFTLAGGIDRIESRSLPGVSLIKIIFKPGTDADSAVSGISNLAMANLRRLPAGTLPPVVLKFDASSLPVCLITLSGEGLDETQLRDLGQFNIRNQIAGAPGASVPQPFGGKYRQIMVYVDPMKLQSRQMSLMDVVTSLQGANTILPGGNVVIGPTDYSVQANSQLSTVNEIGRVPLKSATSGSASPSGPAQVLVADVARVKDGAAIQSNIVRINGQRSVYLPVLKQGGDSNTIEVVKGIRKAVKELTGLPRSLRAHVVFDQSSFVSGAIMTLVKEGILGLALTAVMILVFLGNVRATTAVFLSIPLSALAAFMIIGWTGGTVNSMMLGGLALAFSRLIDNSVVVLENIFRHLEKGEDAQTAAIKGGQEVALPVLAATLATGIVFFPVTLLTGVSRYFFGALASAVVISLAASYLVAITVVPLYCSMFIRSAGGHATTPPHGRLAGIWTRFLGSFERVFAALQEWFGGLLETLLPRARLVVVVATVGCLACLALLPLVGTSYFPRTDPSQFVISVKALPGTSLEETEKLVSRLEQLVRRIVPAKDLGIIVSNIGSTADISAMYTSNSGPHTASVQVSLAKGHRSGSYALMGKVRQAISSQLPELSVYLQAGGLAESVLNMGLPAPIDLQFTGKNQQAAFAYAKQIMAKARSIPEIADMIIPQDLEAPILKMTVDRTRSGMLGLTSKEVISNLVTAIVSNGMIQPNYWIDPASGIDYLLTVQYPEGLVRSINDLKAIPVRSSIRLDAVTSVSREEGPTEIDHYQLQRVINLYVSTRGEAIGPAAKALNRLIAKNPPPAGVRVVMRGLVTTMESTFTSMGWGILLAILLVYLVLVAQFRSFSEPMLILLAVLPGLSGVVITLLITGTTLNIMSLMGVIMMIGIVVTDSILIVESTSRRLEEGDDLRTAILSGVRNRMRPILMTSLATIAGLLPMALKLGTGSEAYAPLARAIVGGVSVSMLVTVILVPCAIYLIRSRKSGAVA
jgi:multidrug efflux pump subunit AcrB